MQQVLTEDGVVIAVHDLGGSGPDLVLAHATGFHGRIWEPVAARLRSRFHCIAVDGRGHGDSGVAPDETFDWHGLATDVLAVVDALGLERPFGAGHSLGATLLLLAEEVRPASYRSLYCYEPIVAPRHDPGPPRPNPMSERARRRRDVFPSREAAYRRLSRSSVLASFSDEALRAYVQHGFEDLEDGSVRLKCRPEHEARVYENGFSHRAFAQLGRIGCPVTLGCGERTDTVGPALLEKHAARLRGASIDVVPRLGHLGPMEDPPAVAAAIDAALR